MQFVSATVGSGTQTVVPVGVSRVVLNVTAIRPTHEGFVSVRPGTPPAAPTTASQDVVAGDIVPNAVNIGVPSSGLGGGSIPLW